MLNFTLCKCHPNLDGFHAAIPVCFTMKLLSKLLSVQDVDNDSYQVLNAKQLTFVIRALQLRRILLLYEVAVHVTGW